MYSMLILDDEYIVRYGIRETIDWNEYSIEIVADADNGKTGLELALKFNPDIIITDIRMPEWDGLEFLKAIKASNIDCIVIILSGYEEFEYVRTALHSGAFAYLLKPIDNNELIKTVLDGIKELDKRRNKQKQYSLLESELPNVKQLFLNNLITGKLADLDAIKEKIKLYGIDISPTNNYVLFLTVNSSDDILKSSDKDTISLIRNTLTSLISKYLNDGNISYVYTETSDLKWTIILSHPHIENAVKSIKNAAKKIIYEFEQITTLTCCVGISNVCKDLSIIHNACDEAEKAVNNNMFTDINRILSIDGIENNMSSRKINEAIKYITANYNKDISVDDVANALYISPSYLMHLLKDNIGKTFNECLKEARINAAKELLVNPKYKVYEVCYKVGYNDIKYFSQVFKRSTGMTPSEYSKKAHVF
ncbi:response regulator transcription factor [Clostridium folliculivorans]|uniref:Stage 0 sporulation protein A homolog n=1 Tax=Clostridium folliculivorans TaxID=2886038 RepID=A0A9W5Y6U9_9CLOT|nr:response regulator [Clostridium folliculivorans]GKU27667.1 hypothetical protein CFOLD11_44940 [Clostridium folliculivorans]GKU32430.1 hypothetical protein CFB3_45380 [Clostridium folliculivorans]